MRRVAIVAGGGTASLAPWHDLSWEIWGMPWIHYPRVTHMFEIHEQAYYDEEGADADRDGQILESGKLYPDAVTICHPSRAYLFPKPVPYPFEEVLKRLPFPYLENSVAYQLAYALHEEIEEIGLWGVHQIGEYVWEKPSVLYLIGLLHGAGRIVHNVPGSPLFMSRFKAGRYGLSGGARFKECL